MILEKAALLSKQFSNYRFLYLKKKDGVLFVDTFLGKNCSAQLSALTKRVKHKVVNCMICNDKKCGLDCSLIFLAECSQLSRFRLPGTFSIFAFTQKCLVNQYLMPSSEP